MADQPKKPGKIKYVRDISFMDGILTIVLGTLVFDDEGKVKEVDNRDTGTLTIHIPGATQITSYPRG